MTGIIISASRRTDIPAYFPKLVPDFLQGKVDLGLNPDKVKLVVFWTKNPKPIVPFLHVLDDLGIPYYFQYTLNNYGSVLEPNVPPLQERIDTLLELSESIGKDRIVWRFDPMLLVYPGLSIFALQDRFEAVGELVHEHVRYLIWSVLDMYGKVKGKTPFNYKFNEYHLQVPNIKKVFDFVNPACEKWGLNHFTCAEKVSEKYRGKCIDPVIIKELVGSCPWTKDPSQRRLCGCVKSVDIGEYGTCGHNCLYCYAN